MFFDCTGLLAGLAASVITKWKANDKYSYGYVRAEVIAGFVNGLFLLFISFFIMSEAVERAIEPPEVRFLINIYSLLRVSNESELLKISCVILCKNFFFFLSDYIQYTFLF